MKTQQPSLLNIQSPSDNEGQHPAIIKDTPKHNLKKQQEAFKAQVLHLAEGQMDTTICILRRWINES